MSYDFAVVLLADVDDRAGSGLYEQLLSEPPAEGEPTAFDPFVAALRTQVPMVDDGGWLQGEPTTSTSGVVVTTSWADPVQNLYALLRLAMKHGLAVYDPQRDRLYDPTSHVRLDVIAGDGTRSPYVSPSLLGSLVDMAVREDSFVILERENEYYAQTRHNADGTMDLECRDGGADLHWHTSTTDPSVVHRTLWSWAVQDPAWRTDVRWTKIRV